MTAHIDLTDLETERLRCLSELTGKSETDLLHEAVERFLADVQYPDWKEAIRHAQGIWKHRTDLPNVSQMRAEFERFGA